MRRALCSRGSEINSQGGGRYAKETLECVVRSFAGHMRDFTLKPDSSLLV